MRFLILILSLTTPDLVVAQAKAPTPKLPPSAKKPPAAKSPSPVRPVGVKLPPKPLDNTPSTGASPPIKGKDYSYKTAYKDGNPSCPKENCVQEYRGNLPAELKDAPISPITGGLICKACVPGIYRYDDYHFVFVQQD